jgi:uncharacterized membrane protein YhaH (DUF805 family)
MTGITNPLFCEVRVSNDRSVNDVSNSDIPIPERSVAKLSEEMSPVAVLSWGVDGVLRRLTRHESWLWVLVIAGFVGDVSTTYLGLQMGLVETNPVARGSIELLGYWSMPVLKSMAIAVGLCCRRALATQYSGIVPLSLGIPWFSATILNAGLIVSIVFLN